MQSSHRQVPGWLLTTTSLCRPTFFLTMMTLLFLSLKTWENKSQISRITKGVGVKLIGMKKSAIKSPSLCWIPDSWGQWRTDFDDDLYYIEDSDFREKAKFIWKLFCSLSLQHHMFAFWQNSVTWTFCWEHKIELVAELSFFLWHGSVPLFTHKSGSG